MQDDRRGDSSRRQLRLPTIAPRDDQASSTSSSRSGRLNTTAVPPRARLPPRSRTGCWTCRTRKVKCDEGRPVCGQCGRLGHTCDYSPKLTFRDDTNRVVERMQDVTVAGSAVWDRQSPTNRGRLCTNGITTGTESPAPSSAGSAIDDLPPFASLLTDEERERKAGASNPGTYNVVVSPESFQHLPEYNNALGLMPESISPLRRGSIASSIGRDSPSEALPLAGDPNIVILPRFEDISRRSTRELKAPTSPVSTGRPPFKREQSGRSPINASDQQFLQHFRDVVWKQLVPPEHSPDSSISLLDEIAANFPPVVRAMVAVASLALSQQNGSRLDSLHHYSQTLPELQSMLKSEEDLASDGAFLTHFLMLIYEIASADSDHPNIWAHHVQTLLRITLLRRRLFGGERFPFIVWWICNIDLDALLGCYGPGEFIGHMLKNDLVPPPSFHLYPLGIDGLSIIYPEEKASLPTVLQLDYEVMLHAVQLGMLAHEFRADQGFRTANLQQRAIQVKIRQTRVFEIQENLRHLWNVRAVHELHAMQLSNRTRRLFQHAWALYRACILYSHTSMWEGQRLDTSPTFDDEIATAAMQILQVAETALAQDRFSCKFLVFPLFLAGFVSTDGTQKLNALSLIEKTESALLSRNTIIARNALEAVYKEQQQQFLNNGHSLDVGWFQVMQKQNLTVVTFGV